MFKLSNSLKLNLVLCWHGFCGIKIMWPHTVNPMSDSTELAEVFRRDLWVHMPYLFKNCATKSRDMLDWIVQTCSDQSNHVSLNFFNGLTICQTFQKCF